MGLPAYPPDWATTWQNVQRGLKQAYTGAQSRVRYAAIRAASLVLGAEQGARIVIDPTGGDASAPAIIFRPQTGSKVAVLEATSAQYADEVTVILRGGVNNGETVYTEITMGGGLIRCAVKDAGSGQIVRSVDITEDYISLGVPVGGKPYIWVSETDGVLLRSADDTWLQLLPDGTVSKQSGQLNQWW